MSAERKPAGGRPAAKATGAKREAPPHRQVQTFLSALEGADQLPPLVLVRGEEDFFIRQVLDGLSQKAGQLGMEVLRHDEADPDFSAALLYNDLKTAPLFAGDQLLVLRSLSKTLEKRGKETAPLVEAVGAFIETKTPGRCLLLEAPGMRADHALVKRIQGAGGALLTLRRLYDSPPPWNPDPRQVELVQWCQERARSRGMNLDAERAVTVVAATGNDLAAIDAQLERLKLAGPAAFKETLVWQSGGSPFAVAQAALCGKTRDALSGVEVLFRRGMLDKSGERKLDPGALVALLNSALIAGARLGLQGARALASGQPLDAALAPAGAPRAKEELAERLRARSDPRVWAQLLESLADLDRNHKRGQSADVDEYARLFLEWALRYPPAGPARASRHAAGGRGPAPGSRAPGRS